MKTLILMILILVVGCIGSIDQPTFTSASSTPKEKEYDSVRVDEVKLSLTDRDGRCTLLYRLANEEEGSVGQIVDVGMSSPCNFIRKSPLVGEPVSHTFQKGKNRHTVLMVTGGAADTRFKDKFQPEGCGTWQTRVQVFSDRVNISFSGYNGPAWCPSSGMDDMLLY